MRKWALVGLSGAAAVVVTVAGWNYFGVFRPVSERLAQDPRNKTVTMWAYHSQGVVPGTLVIDVREITDDTAMIDVTRALFQSAGALKDQQFNRVILAYKGSSKFYLDGNYFAEIGRQFEQQNPVYLVRTMPENVYKMDGTKAFGEWTGGLLGVATRQMEDVNRMAMQWYIEDAARERAAMERAGAR